MGDLRKKLCWLAGVMLSCSGLSMGDLYTVDATYGGRTYEGRAPGLNGEKIVGFWSDGSGKSQCTWLQYDIPVYDGQVITDVAININVVAQYNGIYTEGIRAYYSADDNWTNSTITWDWAYDSAVYVDNRFATNNGNNNGLVSSDITNFLTQAGEGEGSKLSIMLGRTGTGTRGALMTTPTLTITTAPVPEPATIGLIAAGAMFVSRVKRKK